jgi:hypothetical protein
MNLNQKRCFIISNLKIKYRMNIKYDRLHISDIVS